MVAGHFERRAAYTPLRLLPEERAQLRVLEGTLQVSEYTDKVDVISWHGNKAQRVAQQLADAFALLCGLTVASSSKVGQQMVQNRTFEENADFFSSLFEVGRRHKIMNPSQMRSTHGKLIYMLQDAQQPTIRDTLGFSIVCPVQTVHSELESLGALEMLTDPDMPDATAPVMPGEAASRKKDAVDRLVKRYGGDGDDEVSARLDRCLLSVADDEALTEAHVAPAQRMLDLLHEYFDPAAPERGHSLAISAGRNGARLTHSHSAQYAYVEQSLMLWREILSQLSKLWSLAEDDLLQGSSYRLRDTGQGMHRVQAAPRVSRFMAAMLANLQSQVAPRTCS